MVCRVGEFSCKKTKKMLLAVIIWNGQTIQLTQQKLFVNVKKQLVAILVGSKTFSLQTCENLKLSRVAITKTFIL